MAKFTPPSGREHPPKTGAHSPGPCAPAVGGNVTNSSVGNAVERVHGSNTKPPQK